MIYRSPHPEVPIPEVNITQATLGRARARGSRPAVIDADTGRTLSYARLASALSAASVGLARQGLRPGETVVLDLPNVPEYPLVAHSVLAAGGVVAPVPEQLPESLLARLLHHSGARYLVTDPARLPRGLAASRGTGVRQVLTVDARVTDEDRRAAPGPQAADEAVPFSSLMSPGGPTDTAPPAPGPGDLAVLGYGGSQAGLPRAARLRHHNLVAGTLQLVVTADIRTEDRVATTLPFGHPFGFGGVLNHSLCLGATLVTAARPDLADFLAMVERHRVTVAVVGPPMVRALAEDPLVSQYGLGSLRLVVCTGAPLAAATALACRLRTGAVVKQAYGLAEAAPATHFHALAEQEGEYGSVGPCLPWTQCRVVDPPSGADRVPGDPGELLVRGPQVASEYHGGPAGGHPPTGDEDGWVRTGDIAFADELGRFHVVDRRTDLITVRGRPASPRRVEDALLRHPAVVDAAVAAVPGRTATGYVVLRRPVSDDELHDHLAELLPPHQRAVAPCRVEHIPRTAAGRVLFARLDGRALRVRRVEGT
ncbi:AMP-binding protein [Allonocardiopsis opalescens]|uniref:Acyl-CoA synthetase (AMP-forming)/AMP-acid ligase II n=1 Tax=Allonocardiopsis opalescens TaxID=1144618 RepID=A0A2T0QDY6_9ACTN|nr:AMP-binding protein [Allonocardiopsis opalescens]PRY02154.1 acyl-CoA synthetase (AMP-forming)/AMP-acid ligase II [Allonocardiopsis opalescens]